MLAPLEIGYHFLSGDTGYKSLIPWLDVKAFRDASAAWSGLIAVAPFPSGGKADKKQFIISPSRNYTVSDYRDALIASKRQKTLDIWDDVAPLMADPEKDPGVPVWCAYGSNVDSVTSVIYTKDDLSDEKPTVVMTKAGDGTVHRASLEVCKRWDSASVKEYPGVCHTCLLTSQNAISDFGDFVANLLK